MKNLKIRTKLLATFMLVIILFIGTVAIAIYGLQANANKYSEFYNVEYKVTNNIMSMRRGLQIIVKDLAFITIESDESKKGSYQDELQTELTALEENAYWLFDNFTGDSQLLDSFSDCIHSYWIPLPILSKRPWNCRRISSTHPRRTTWRHRGYCLKSTSPLCRKP